MSDDPHETATALRFATFHLARRLRAERADDTLGDSSFAVLTHLRKHGRQSLGQLAQRERVTSPTMTSTINGLAEDGYVIRIPDETDRRRVLVEVTPAGDEIVEATVAKRDAALEAALAECGFTADELRTLRDAAILMRKVAER